MSKLSGEFEVVDLEHQRDMNYVSEHMQAVMTLPGTGENSYANTSPIDEMLEAMPNPGQLHEIYNHQITLS